MKKPSKAKRSVKAERTAAPTKKKKSSAKNSSGATPIDYHTCVIAFDEFGITFEYQPEAAAGQNPPYTSSTNKQAYEDFIRPYKGQGGAAGMVGLPNAAFARRQHLRTFSHERPSQIAYCLDVSSGWRFTDGGFGLKRMPNSMTKFFGDPEKFSPPKISPTGKVCEVRYTPDGTTGSKSEFQYELYLEADVANNAGPNRPAYVKIIIDPPANNGMIPPG